MEEQIRTLLNEINAYGASDKQALEAFRNKYISRKGIVSELFEELKGVPVEQKKTLGKILNHLKQAAEAKLDELTEKLNTNTGPHAEIDLTLPPVPNRIGNLHPLSLTRYRIIEIFERLGFNVADGSEIEDDWHNFSALNFPENHPARENAGYFFY